MKINKFIRLGMLMAFSIFVLVWGLSYLKGHDFFKPVNYYYARYDRVDGLVESSLITVNGYKVGSVRSVKFAPDRSGDLIVTLMIDSDFRIPRNSVAQIVSSDIMGTRAIKLIYSGESGYHLSGDTLASDIESDLKEQVSLQVLPLKTKAEELLGTLDSAITVLTVIFNEDARKNLSESFENINQTIANIERASGDLAILVSEERNTISRLVRNMETFSGTLKDNSGEFQSILANLSAFSDTLASLPLTPVINDISASVDGLNQLIGKANSDETTLGLLFNDQKLYNNINDMTAGLSHLLTDVRVNPKRYVHFSALDLGREVYINTGSTDIGNRKNIVFKVHLISTPDQLPLNSPLFDGMGHVEEFSVSGAFTYLAGNFSGYNEAESLLMKAYRNFPDATIVAFKDGKNIRLERALRQLR
jgi:phospholipid/cholesterol/gamma-HCH transport system substrate-binding protein